MSKSRKVTLQVLLEEIRMLLVRLSNREIYSTSLQVLVPAEPLSVQEVIETIRRACVVALKELSFDSLTCEVKEAGWIFHKTHSAIISIAFELRRKDAVTVPLEMTIKADPRTTDVAVLEELLNALREGRDVNVTYESPHDTPSLWCSRLPIEDLLTKAGLNNVDVSYRGGFRSSSGPSIDEIEFRTHEPDINPISLRRKKG